MEEQRLSTGVPGLDARKRVSVFQRELRRLTVDGAGIRVGEKLQHLHGVPTGVPTISAEPA